MKPVLEAFATLNKSVDTKPNEKSPCSRPSAKRHSSITRKSTINKYKKGSSIFSSGKKQKSMNEFVASRLDKRNQVAKATNSSSKTSLKSLLDRTHQKNTAGLDETSSSSFTYSSNSQRFIDVDIAGHCSKLDIDSRLEIVELVDNQVTARSENEESEKENSPRLKRNQTSTRSGGSAVQVGSIENSSSTKTYQAIVKEIKYCEESFRDDFCRPEGYYRYLEGDCSERQEKVEYDLDDEDMCWLNTANNSKCRLAGKLTEDSLEMAIDRLEKLSANLQLNCIKSGSVELKNKTEEICDDDIYCSICLDDECQNSNAILLCDSCNLAAHQECYGIPYVPEGQWLCSWCSHKKANSSSEGDLAAVKKTCTKSSMADKSVVATADNGGVCCLCPVRGGALKKTNDDRWAHVLCALWIPEVGFDSIDYLEPITKLDEVPPARHKLTCSVCKKKDAGACIQCMKRNCYTAFHIMCAQQVGTYMKIEQGSNDVGETLADIKKSFFCDQHKPDGAKPFTPMYDNDSSDGEDEEDDGVAEGESSQNKKSKSKRTIKSRAKAGKKGKDKRGKEVLLKNKSSKGLSAKSVGSNLCQTTVMPDLPQIPQESLIEIEEECFGTSSSGALIETIYNYWILKRRSRSNVPLLKAFYTTLMSNNITERLGGADSTKAALEGLKDAKRLRNEMEKVRLLLELVRKREKVKLLMIKTKEQEVTSSLHPWNSQLMKVLTSLQQLDKCDVFAHPVCPDQVPGYGQKINTPMDFSTMRQKVSGFVYEDFENFETDFHLMIANCLKFNSKHTMYHKAATKIKKQAVPLLEEARGKLSIMSFDPIALPLRPSSISSHIDDDDDDDCKNGNDGGFEDRKAQEGVPCLPLLKKSSDQDVEEKLEETICYDQHNDGSDSKIQGEVKREAVDEEMVCNEDVDETIIIRTSDATVNDADDSRDRRTLEADAIDATKSYVYEDGTGNEERIASTDDEDDSDDLIIETISLNDEDDAPIGLTAFGGDPADHVPDSVEENELLEQPVCLESFLGSGEQRAASTKISKKKEILKFLASLRRLVENSAEEAVERNLMLESESRRDPSDTTSGITLNISDTFVSILNESGKEKYTREPASKCGKDHAVQHCSPNISAKTPARHKFNPQSNSTPLNEARQSFSGTSNSQGMVKSNKKPVTKKSIAQSEGANKASANEMLTSQSNSSSDKLCSALTAAATLDNALSGDAGTQEVRRMSERTKTATHRYLIDDDHIFAALVTPSKNKKRKNSSTMSENCTDGSTKRPAEDEPPVLSRCPSPMEEEETRSAGPLTFYAKKSDQKGMLPFDGAAEDCGFEKTLCSNASLSGSVKNFLLKDSCRSNSVDDRCLEPSQKRPKLDNEMAPPLLVKSVDEAAQNFFKISCHKTLRAPKSAAFSLKKAQSIGSRSHNKSKTKSAVGMNAVSIKNFVLFTSKTSSAVRCVQIEKEGSDHDSESRPIEMPRLDESNIPFQSSSVADCGKVADVYACEDVLIAEESYVDDGPCRFKDDRPVLDSESLERRRDSKEIKNSPSTSTSNLKKQTSFAKRDKFSKDGSDEFHLKQKFLVSTLSGDDAPEASSDLMKESSAEEITAANALLDFRRSFCQNNMVLESTSEERRNIFDEFGKLHMPCQVVHDMAGGGAGSSPRVPNSIDCTEKKQSPAAASQLLSRVDGQPADESRPVPEVPTFSNKSQVSFVPLAWKDFPKPSTEESQILASKFSGSPEIDSAYSTSSSSSSSSSLSSSCEERCSSVL